MFKLWLKFQIFLAVGSVLADPCTISIPTDLPDPQPVFVTQQGLFRPINQVTEVQEGEELTLHCAGKGNVVVPLKQQTVTLVCRGGDFYNTETDEQQTLKDLKCTRIPTSELQVTETTCADGAGVFYEVGFLVNDNFHSVFTICYDSANEHTIYSRSLVNGAAQSFKINDSTRRAFKADGLRFSTTATNNFYVNKNQKSRFASYFGAKQAFVNRTSFLARGHMAPDADFVFSYEQLATYYYANCAPEWQVVNAGNWLRVENAVRKLASQLGSDVLTYTSTLGVLELTNPTDNKETQIYLDKTELIPAPEWYYKIVMHPSLAADVVFITRNNPFEDVGKEVEFCTNVCDKYDLDLSYYEDSRHGYTFCCELNDFWVAAMNTDSPNFDLPDGWSYKN
uniref:Nuclease EXOG, mitochondrial n=1 Tax=Ceratitis capitata TaxID=7213 RepID=W8C9U0_CERCA